MSRRSFAQLGRWVSLGVLLLVGAAPDLWSQTSTGSIRGYVTDSLGNPLVGARVTAVNAANSAQREVQTQSNGFYAILGLAPAEYAVTARQIGMAAQKASARVLIGEVLSLNFKLTASAVQLEAVTVSAAATGVETRTSEVATNVTQQQIRQLPTPSRNFLDLAALAPGVNVTPDFVNLGASTVTPRTFTSGASGPGSVNVFIDGASLKNDLTGGESGASAISGQDASRGNPFPRNAIQEYRVLTQNFKAEYQNASSAIISATTRSGTNDWSGDAFFNFENKDLVTLDSISLANKVKKPDYSRYLLGLSAGGPLVRDRLFFFGSYEGNYQNRSNLVTINDATTAFGSLTAKNLNQYAGSFASPFRESLVFGKLNYTVSNNATAELSVNVRHETDQRDFGGTTSFQGATNFHNDELTGILKYTYTTGPWLDEASATYTNFDRNPWANTGGLAHQHFNPTTNFSGADIGSYVSFQDFRQKGLTLRDNVTYTGFHGGGDHVFKAGVTVDFASFDIIKANNEVPNFLYGDTVAAGDCNCNAQSVYAYRVPFQVQLQVGDSLLNTTNTQVGAFLQDDWSPTPRLTLNLGIRWDYESNMLDNSYRTPQDVRDTIGRYANDTNFLATPIDTGRFFTNGSQRHPFTKAFQPRLGFSYALDDQNQTTIFGGWGLYYDRTYFDIAVDEQQKLTRPSYTIYFADSGATPVNKQVPWNDNYLTSRAAVDSLVTAGVASGNALHEVWLIPNDLKMPHSAQWNVGIRHLFGDVLVSAAYVGVRGYDGVVGNWANIRWVYNVAAKDTNYCCDFKGNAHGISNVIFFSNGVKTWYDALQVQITRPYKKVGAWGWGGGLSFTSGQRSVQGNDNPDDELAFPQTIFIPKHPSNDERSHVVANWIVDLPFAYGIQFSGLMTLGTGPRYDIGGRFSPYNWRQGAFTPPQYPFIIPGAWAYRDVDIRLSKDFPQIGKGTTSVTLDVFNVFNFQNFSYGTDGTAIPNGLLSDGRRIAFGAEYRF